MSKLVLTFAIIIAAFALTVPVSAQKKISVFLDNDVPAGTVEYDAILVVNDANIASVVVRGNQSQDISGWRTYTIPADRRIPVRLKVANQKPTSYSIVAFGGDGKALEIRAISVPAGVSEQEVAAAGDDPKPLKEMTVQKPASAVESNYDLEIRPLFDKAKYANATSFRVVRKVKGKEEESSKTITVPIRYEKDNPAKPTPSQFVDVPLARGLNEITVSILDNTGNLIPNAPIEKLEIDCDEACQGFGRSINTRAIIGLEQVGASSAAGKTYPFIDFFINVPLGDNDNAKETPPRVSLWTDFRLSSSTAQRFANLANITTNILRPNANDQINDVIQTFRVNVGFDIRLIREKSLFPSFHFAKSSVSLIVGGGVSSPLTGGKSSVTEIYKIPKANGQIIPEFLERFPGISNDKINVAFVTPERDRFMRRWFVGGRLVTHFYKDKKERFNLSPAMLDITTGQDESITRKLSGFVINLEGFTPFPINRNDYLFLFAGISTRLTRKVNSNVPPFFLEPANIADLADPLKTVLISSDENRFTVSNRDKYYFGIGIDLIRLFRRSQTTP